MNYLNKTINSLPEPYDEFLNNYFIDDYFLNPELELSLMIDSLKEVLWREKFNLKRFTDDEVMSI